LTEAVVFYIFAVLCIFSSIIVVTHKNPVACAISMVLTFFFTAVLFILLRAQFVAVIQVLVYAGAIIVLFLFTVMFLNIKEEGMQFDAKKKKKKVLNSGPKPPVIENFGSVESVGRDLFTEFLLPFELTSVLIIVAIIGVVTIARRSKSS